MKVKWSWVCRYESGRTTTTLLLDEPTPLWNETRDRLWIAGKEHDFGYSHVNGRDPDTGLPLGPAWVIPGCHDLDGATVLRREGAHAKAEARAQERRNAEMEATSWNGGPCAAKVAGCMPIYRAGEGYQTAVAFDVPVPTAGVTKVQIGGKEHEFVYTHVRGFDGRAVWPPRIIGIDGLHDLEGATAYFR